jgi:hypothetical protein
MCTIIKMDLDKPYGERAIVKALKIGRNSCNIRIQPINGSDGLGYLLVENKKSKADAEAAFMTILGNYFANGGQEFEVSDLPADAEAPVMAYITNDKVREPAPLPKSDWTVSPELIRRAKTLKRMGL